MSILTCFFLALIHHAASITFNFTNFNPSNSHDIILSGDAGYSNTDDGIQVTYKNENVSSLAWLAGRATYVTPLHLWKNDSPYLASFTTSFTFAITRLTSFTFGRDDWDPKSENKFLNDHVGININSLTSVVSRNWNSEITTVEKLYTASINYDSDSKMLSVSFTNYVNNVPESRTGLDHTIDLKDVLPEWVIFGFSASTGDRYAKHVVKSWTFTDFKVDENNGKNNTLVKKGLIIAGTLVLVTVLALFAYLLWRRKNNSGFELGSTLEMNNEFEIGAAIPRRFSYLDLVRSTADFAETEKLGEGGFGGVYKGFLKDLGMYVAVKRVSNTSNQGIKEYASEIRIISRLRHRNLVQLIGWCHENGELMLVYEFLENGSLDLHLFKGKSLLTWNTRYKIAHGLASALLYLHEEWEQCVLHRDIKSSNVMLDSNFNAKLGDFGLAKLVDHENGSETTTKVAGTVGYIAPEYAMTGKASKESDVFSFGVVALEIACGRMPIDSHAEEKKINLVEWVWDLYGSGTLLEAADPCLGSTFAEEEMTSLMIVGLWCAHPDSRLRPSIKQAIQVLNSEASLPILQAKMPNVAYSGQPNFSKYDTSLSSVSTKRSSKTSTSSAISS